MGIRNYIITGFFALLFSHTGMAGEHRSGAYLTSKAQYHLYPGRYDIVMLGDSLTERGKWQDMFPDVRIGNRGISGDDTQGIIDRLGDVKRTHAKKVFLMAGTNDLSEKISPKTVSDNIIRIAEGLSEDGVIVVIQSTLYGNSVRKLKNEWITQINDALLMWCNSNNIQFVNLNSIIATNGFLPDEKTVDGIHLTIKGYEEWKSVISPFVK